MAEGEIVRDILLAASKLGARLFRQNVGTGWTGQVERGQKGGKRAVFLGPQDVVIRNARPLHAGLCVGSSDCIGFVPVEITPDHVGKTLAVFAALEVKFGSTRTTKEQAAFIDVVKRNGGVAAVVRSVEESVEQIEGPKRITPR